MFRPQSNSPKGLKVICTVQPEMLRGKSVLVRCDFNVDVQDNGKIVDTIRIDKAFKTINYLKNSRARVILISHIGRDKKETLRPVYKYLSKKYDLDFIENFSAKNKKKISLGMKEGDIVLIENLRKWPGEIKNEKAFVKRLSNLADIFVNEAFSVSHRDHASVTGVPQNLPSYIGFNFRDEVDNISKIFDAEHPFLAIIGGAKFKTKIKVIESLEDQADIIFVGGALANDVYKAKGFEIGDSFVSDINKKIIDRLVNSENILVPIDVKTVNKIGLKQTKNPEKIKKSEMIIDGGPKTAKMLKKKIRESKMIIWNGPLGLYEKGHNYLTKKVAKEIEKSNAFSIVGGGDTLVEINNMGNIEKYDFVSTAGGAMLEFIGNGTLVGIEAIKNQ